LNSEPNPREQSELNTFVSSKSFDDVSIKASTTTKGVPSCYEFKFKLSTAMLMPDHTSTPGSIWISFPYDPLGKAGFKTDLGQSLLNSHATANGSIIDCPFVVGATHTAGAITCSVVQGLDKVYVKVVGFTAGAAGTLFHFHLLLGNPIPDNGADPLEMDVEILGY
jgi:hypothetical protein